MLTPGTFPVSKLCCRAWKLASSSPRRSIVTVRGFRIQKPCVQHLRMCCRGFLHAYSTLAQESYNRQRSLFGLVPKFHAMCHFQADCEDYLRSRPRDSDLMINPSLVDCSANEDFVGRAAQQSRHVGYRLLLDNLFRAYLVKFKFLARDHFN